MWKQTPHPVSFPVAPTKIPKWLLLLLSALCITAAMMNSCWLHFGWAIISFPSFCSFVIHYLIYSLRPISSEGGGAGRGRRPVGGACRLWFQHPGQPPVSCLWTAGRRLLRTTGWFSKKSLHLQIQRSTAPSFSPCLMPCFLLHGWVVFPPPPARAWSQAAF